MSRLLREKKTAPLETASSNTARPAAIRGLRPSRVSEQSALSAASLRRKRDTRGSNSRPSESRLGCVTSEALQELVKSEGVRPVDAVPVNVL